VGGNAIFSFEGGSEIKEKSKGHMGAEDRKTW